MNKPNWEILALTRFFLASIVMVGHLGSYTEIGFLKYYTSLGSFEAILGFLLISGFSIGMSIKRNSNQYFKRRIFRIYPVYIASIVFAIILNESLPTPQMVLVIIANMVFLNNVIISQSFVGPAWTLATEVALYALVPFFLRVSRKVLIYFIIASFVLHLTYSYGQTFFNWNYYATTNYGINIPILAFIWISGFILAVHPNSYSSNLKVIKLLLVGQIAATILIQALDRIKHNDTSALISIDLLRFMAKSVCLLIVYLIIKKNSYIKISSFSINKVLNIAGNISYPLYLTHCTSFAMLKRSGISNPYLMILVSISISYIIYYMFDFYSKRREYKHDDKALRRN